MDERLGWGGGGGRGGGGGGGEAGELESGEESGWCGQKIPVVASEVGSSTARGVRP